ncbi:TadE/TadG family type IV pilus assembly protein [Roseitranquillus sediminis]|uniref:TadE/TadG family type IV pilus assembly protein n=1 Tax=Roseitranquillus sediminis TaxID=2809051 RepID=UPI001D0C6D0F|nr:TadE/TadG family type IV pilus assembly protein [Roseitranquillus sediminis]MBM9594758.1 pilus assembly protein [Roseitranquillus sediminis]
MKSLPRLLFDRSGAAALEFAIIGLPFILLLLGLVEFGRGLHIRNALDAAADRAQRAIMIDPSANGTMLEEAIHSGFHAGQPEQITVRYATETVAGTAYRLVSLDFEMQLLLPAPLGRNLTISSTRRIALPG